MWVRAENGNAYNLAHAVEIWSSHYDPEVPDTWRVWASIPGAGDVVLLSALSAQDCERQLAALIETLKAIALPINLVPRRSV